MFRTKRPRWRLRDHLAHGLGDGGGGQAAGVGRGRGRFEAGCRAGVGCGWVARGVVGPQPKRRNLALIKTKHTHKDKHKDTREGNNGVRIASRWTTAQESQPDTAQRIFEI